MKQKQLNSLTPFKNWPKVAPQIACATSASWALLCTGLVRGWSSSAIPQLQYDKGSRNESIYLEHEEAAWMTSLPPLCAVFGSLLISLPMQMYGRRITLIGISIPFVLGFYLMALSYYVQWVPLLFVGRVITGLVTGASAPTAQIYVSECSSPRVRGALGSFTATALSLGILIAYIIGALVQWHVLCFILGSLPAVLGLAMMFMPETPSWLMSHQQEPEARVALQQLRGKHTDIEEEFNRIKNKDVERQGQEAVSLFGALGASGGALMRPLVISLALMFFQQFSGINAVIFYSASIFQAAGSSVDRFISSITIAIVQLVCTLLAALSVDRFGRRCLLLISGAFMATSLTGLAAYLHLTTTSAAADGDATGEDQLQLMTQLGWIPLLCLMSFIVAYSAGFGAVPQLVMSELFPIEYRHQLSTVSTSFNLCCAFLVVRTFPEMSHAMGLAAVYALYAACSLVGVVFVFFSLPETKGRTLEEISQLFSSPHSPYSSKNTTGNKSATGVAIDDAIPNYSLIPFEDQEQQQSIKNNDFI